MMTEFMLLIDVRICVCSQLIIEFMISTIGALLLYSMLMVALLWLFHTATFFWGVMWPYHYSVTRDEGRIKYIHIFVLLVSCIMPTVSVVAVQFSGGYGLSITTGHLCGIMKSEDLFYGVLLPLDVIIIIVVTLLLITGWRIADIVNMLYVSHLWMYIINYQLCTWKQSCDHRLSIYRKTDAPRKK